MKKYVGERFWIITMHVNAFLLIGLTLFAQDPVRDSSAKVFHFRTVVIDPGHGGKDPGAHGAFSLEKNVALSLAKKLRAALQSAMPELNVLMTRSEDTFIELNHRSAIANEHHANLFISIHCNSSPEGIASRANKQKGALVLVYGFHRKEEQLEAIRENASIYQEKNYQQHYEAINELDPTSVILLNAYLQKYRRQSIQFAELLIHEFQDHDKRDIIGVKEQGVLVLAHSAMPAVLIETGFINNPSEEKYLNSPEGQNEIVQTIVRAVQKYRKSIDPY